MGRRDYPQKGIDYPESEAYMGFKATEIVPLIMCRTNEHAIQRTEAEARAAKACGECKFFELMVHLNVADELRDSIGKVPPPCTVKASALWSKFPGKSYRTSAVASPWAPRNHI